jgi:predicted Zn-ribbon and HTH transcriptional regulator
MGRKKVIYVLEERDDTIDFAKIYERLTGEKFDESVQKEIEKIKNQKEDEPTRKRMVS